MEKRNILTNFKVKHGDKIYDKITEFYIDNWDKKQIVRFTNKENDTTFVNINCKLEDIEILKGN